VQRGIRGIFVGFPTNQAGWHVYIPQSGHLLTSCDVQFYEFFQSILQYNTTLFHDSMPTRANPPTLPLDPTMPINYTGPPIISSDTIDDSIPWTKYSAIPPNVDEDYIFYESIAPLIDVFGPNGHSVEERVPIVVSSQWSIKRLRSIEETDLMPAT
jgi:hypothetical protein